MNLYIVDDWNWEQVRNGTMNSITELGLEIKKSVTMQGNHEDPTGW
jgi:hypothetical protein